jgi:hypothetical protein
MNLSTHKKMISVKIPIINKVGKPSQECIINKVGKSTIPLKALIITPLIRVPKGSGVTRALIGGMYIHIFVFCPTNFF